jgi:hypothetical protein
MRVLSPALQTQAERYDAAMRTMCSLFAMTLLAACHKSDNAPGPGGVTVGEARALDQAAEMIEQRQLPASALRSPAPQPTIAASSAP